MAVPIEVSDETFAKLQALAKPFVDTPESVIRRLADEALAKGHPTGTERHVADDIINLDPHVPANLAHTRVRFARLGKQEVDRPNWNKLLRETHAYALKKLGSLDALRRSTSANIKDGRYELDGFSYVSGSNFSIQGLDSNLAWQNCLRLVKRLGIGIEVEFTWYDKDGAAYPGKRGRVAWTPD
jgi:hypothetical protein